MSYGPVTAMGLLTARGIEQLRLAFNRLWPAEATRKFGRLLADIDLVDEFCKERDRLKIPMI